MGVSSIIAINRLISREVRYSVRHANWASELALLPDKSVDHALCSCSRVGMASKLVRVTRGWIIAFCELEDVGSWQEACEENECRWFRPGVIIDSNRSVDRRSGQWSSGVEAVITMWSGEGKPAHSADGTGVFMLPMRRPGDKRVARIRPIELYMEIVRAFSGDDDLILDPCCSAAASGVACLRRGRRFLGLESDAQLLRIAQEWMSAEASSTTMEDEKRRQLPLFPDRLDDASAREDKP